ncbi:hypothetical protein BH11PSE2_BH11PSE2_19780 [soil metagenome]
MKILTSLVAAATLAGSFTLPIAVPAAQAEGAATPCFFVNQWHGWSAPSDKEILLRVNRDIYRVEVSGGANVLNSPGAFLISTHRGGNSVCTALDLDLMITESHGPRMPLIARNLTKLSAEEAKAVPKKFQP